jgi:hypothetical protein
MPALMLLLLLLPPTQLLTASTCSPAWPAAHLLLPRHHARKRSAPAGQHMGRLYSCDYFTVSENKENCNERLHSSLQAKAMICCARLITHLQVQQLCCCCQCWLLLWLPVRTIVTERREHNALLAASVQLSAVNELPGACCCCLQHCTKACLRFELWNT